MSHLKKAIAQLGGMNSVHGYLYGHYDSRGGTVFVVAKSRKEADEHYAFNVFYTDLDVDLLDEDFLGETTLYYTGSLPYSGKDLEDTGYVLADTQS